MLCDLLTPRSPMVFIGDFKFLTTFFNGRNKMINLKNKSAVILNPERSEWASRSHVTGVEPVVNDGAKTKRYSAKRDLYGDFAYAQPLKMTAFAFLLSLNISTSWADNCSCSWGGADNKTLTITNCYGGQLSSSACSDQKTANNVVVGTGVTSIGDLAFLYATGLTSITIPEGVTSIGSYAFYYTPSLTSITLPDSLTSIGDSAFLDASGLESITIPEGVTSIGSDAFNSASSLTSITIPEGVTSIGSNAFWGATGLTEIIIPDSLTAEQITKLKNASLKSGLTVYCQGDTETCKDALDDAGYSYAEVKQADSTRCSGKYIYDTTCRQRNENECNSVAKYYYNNTSNQCQVLPKTQSACTGANIEWNATDNKCVNKNYTPQQEVNNGDTGGDDVGDISGDFNPADCYNKGQVPYDNQCWNEYPFAKKRWTPAEASKWLHDGNDNFVVITFKK